MTEFTCSFAGLRVGICALFPATREFCVDYLCEGETAFTVETTPEDIAYERTKSDQTAIAEGRKPYPFTDEYLETLAVYRKLASGLSAYDTILFHGSVIAVDGEAYLFTAPSGTGKSTHARLWRKLFGERAFMVNDDKPLLKISDSGVLAYGTPWDGKHRLSRNVSVPLKAICLLERGTDNEIVSCTPAEVYPNLLGQTYRPKASEAMVRVLQLVDRLSQGVSLYRMRCNMNLDAARVSYECMSGRKAVEGER